MNHKLAAFIMKGKFIVANIHDECIFGLDLMREYGLIVDLKSGLLRASHIDIPLLAMGTFAVQQVRSKLDLVQELVESCQKILSAEQIKSLKKTVLNCCDVFVQHDSTLGRTSLIQHQINTVKYSPIKQESSQMRKIESLIESVKRPGIIELSSSPWSSLVTLVLKKDATTTFCVDYRKLNEVTRKDSYPLPRINDIFDVFHGVKWFCTLDLKSGYWQVEVSCPDREKATFTIGSGLWQFTVMPLELCNAPATFEQLIGTVLHRSIGKICLVYLDDVVVFESTVDEFLQQLCIVFEKLRKARRDGKTIDSYR